MKRIYNRRSFMARVAGGAAAMGGAALAVRGAAAQQPGEGGEAETPPQQGQRFAVDRDPSDPARRPQSRTATKPVRTDSDPSDATGRGSAPREAFVICPGNPRCPR